MMGDWLTGLLFMVFVYILIIAIGVKLAKKAGYSSSFGVFTCFLLGPLGLIVLLILSFKQKKEDKFKPGGKYPWEG